MLNIFLSKQYVDHFLQAQIIQRLAASENPIRFSELKEDGIENSLFMYHANKLIDRGLIEKNQDGFRLTIKGARWANYAGSNLLIKELTPRPLVQCIILSDNSILVTKRTGSLKTHLNEYMLPGGLHYAGMSARESIKIVVDELFIKEMSEPSFKSIVESIVEYEDGFVHHTISHIFELSLLEKNIPKNTDQFEYKWIDLSKVTKANSEFKNSQIVPAIIEKWPNLGSYELFAQKQI